MLKKGGNFSGQCVRRLAPSQANRRWIEIAAP
jgi:hypothetical protein